MNSNNHTADNENFTDIVDVEGVEFNNNVGSPRDHDKEIFLDDDNQSGISNDFTRDSSSDNDDLIMFSELNDANIGSRQVHIGSICDEPTTVNSSSTGARVNTPKISKQTRSEVYNHICYLGKNNKGGEKYKCNYCTNP